MRLFSTLSKALWGQPFLSALNHSPLMRRTSKASSSSVMRRLKAQFAPPFGSPRECGLALV